MLTIDIKTTAPIISSNFTQSKLQLENILKEYDLIVDEDSVKTAKKMATEINRLSKDIDTLRKEKVLELSAPIKDFEEEAKDLTALCQTSRQKLLSQVKVFEDKELERATTLLYGELTAAYLKYGVKKEFQFVRVDDLTIISNLNKTGLAKKAKDAIDERVLEAKQFQEKIDTRLLTLEAICFKSGLQAPLTRVNIEHFLKEGSDDIYLKKLVSLIHNEISRIEEMKKREEKEVVVNTQPLQKTQSIQPKEAPPVQTPDEKFPNFRNSVFAKTATPTKRSYTVTATFEVEVDEEKALQLEQMLLTKFANSGFKTVPSIYVEESKNVA